MSAENPAREMYDQEQAAKAMVRRLASEFSADAVRAWLEEIERESVLPQATEYSPMSDESDDLGMNFGDTLT